MRRYIVAIAVILGALAVTFWWVDDSRSFQACRTNYPATTATDQQPKSNQESAANLVGGGSIRQCVGVFIVVNNPAITAFSTFLLVIVTAGLVFIGYQQFRTSRGQLRAYVFLESVSITDGATWPNAPVPVESGCPNSFLRIKNFGETPAYEVRHVSEVVICPTATMEALKVPRVPKTVTKSAIGPDGVTVMGQNLGRAITPFEITGLATLGHAIVVLGRITYRDAFGRKRFTNYKLGYGGAYPPPPGHNLIFLNSGNEAN